MATVRLDHTTLGALAYDLIKDPGLHLGHLQGVPMVFVFETGWKGEKEFLFGRVSMKSHLAAVALRGLLREGEAIECDNSEKCFLIEVNHELWIAISNPDSGYKPEEAESKRRQGMYHLLLHCNIHPETQALMTSKPDTQLFSEEISVWGEDCIPLKAVMARLKNRPSEAGLLQSLYLTPQEWTRAVAIAGIERPKRGYKIGKGKDILVIGGGVAPGATLSEHSSVFALLGEFQSDASGRFFQAARLKAWESVHGQPELPYDARFVVPGMQVETEGVAWDDETGEDVEPTGGRWVIAETGYRLLEPEYGSHPKEPEQGEGADSDSEPEHKVLVVKVEEEIENKAQADPLDPEPPAYMALKFDPRFDDAYRAFFQAAYASKLWNAGQCLSSLNGLSQVANFLLTGVSSIKPEITALRWNNAAETISIYQTYLDARSDLRGEWLGIGEKAMAADCWYLDSDAPKDPSLLAEVLSDEEWEASAKRLGIGVDGQLGDGEPVGAGIGVASEGHP